MFKWKNFLISFYWGWFAKAERSPFKVISFTLNTHFKHVNQQLTFSNREFEIKSKEILRACKQLFGFRLSLSDKKVTLTSLKSTENFIQFKVSFTNVKVHITLMISCL